MSCIQLSNFNRLSAQQVIPVNLDRIIADIQDDLELVIYEKHAIVKKDQLPTINGIPGQINQLFFNLFSNALKFSNPGVPVLITIANTPVSAQEISTKN